LYCITQGAPGAIGGGEGPEFIWQQVWEAEDVFLSFPVYIWILSFIYGRLLRLSEDFWNVIKHDE
jgi:hypothetical protein